MAQHELFHVVVRGTEPPQDARIPVLIWWAKRLAELGFTPSYGPGDHGNLSCRTADGALITARATRKAMLHPHEIVRVWEPTDTGAGYQIAAQGARLPSTDTLVHLKIYALRPDAQAIFHGHDLETLANANTLRLPITTHSDARPSFDVIDEICALIQRNDYVLLRDHGFLAVGKSLDDAGELMRQVSARARSTSLV